MNGELNNQNLSKKELRDLKYRAKIAKREFQIGRNQSRRYLIWGGTALIIIFAVWGVIRAVPRDINQTGVGIPEAVSSNDWTRGNKDSKVTLIEYSDFQCPACASYALLLTKITQDYGDKVLFVYRHFPLVSIHKTAILSATAAEAAGKQNKFWEMSDKLFQNQSRWADNPDAEDMFIGYAGELGLDLNKYKSDLDSKELKNKIEDSYQKATAIRLNYTPSIFLNGNLIKNPASYDEFKAIIESAIEANS